ncbi:hypothetical protein HM1_2486 [Heliomicrobium modesticaldum Ice1]|uniref:Uncharacterized protein n=1 Tax=Heliobacterium modesticaldum (strain ATCC 51547 / Ice1) TaxID=498761 RepID=B0TAI5_HELMI|nr:hypothetical protein HM1_2486 [Heliomicrobium modesticaldum Ice1]
MKFHRHSHPSFILSRKRIQPLIQSFFEEDGTGSPGTVSMRWAGIHMIRYGVLITEENLLREVA